MSGSGRVDLVSKYLSVNENLKGAEWENFHTGLKRHFGLEERLDLERNYNVLIGLSNDLHNLICLKPDEVLESIPDHTLKSFSDVYEQFVGSYRTRVDALKGRNKEDVNAVNESIKNAIRICQKKAPEVLTFSLLSQGVMNTINDFPQKLKELSKKNDSLESQYQELDQKAKILDEGLSKSVGKLLVTELSGHFSNFYNSYWRSGLIWGISTIIFVAITLWQLYSFTGLCCVIHH